MHAYQQHRRHPSNRGTLCGNISSMHEIVVERRANVATAILRREHEPGKVHVYLVIIPIISRKKAKIIQIRTKEKKHTKNPEGV